jgi:virginiamycin B lyase
MSDAEYEKLLPDGPGTKFAADQCTNCHSLLPVVSARKTREQWQQSYDRMLDDMYDMRKLMIYHQPSENSDLVLGYLAKSFGPDTPPDPRVMKEWLLEPGGPAHPNRNLPATLLKGAAAKYVALEFSLPAGAEPHDVAVDSQGVAWVSEKHTGMLGRFDPNSLAYTRIAVPPGKNPKIQLNAVTVDSHDQVWVADDGPNGRILQYDPKGKEFTSYLMPEYRFMVPPNIGWARTQTLRVTNGNVWAAGITSSRILKLDINSRKIIDYSVPKGSLPFGLVVAEDNSPWFTSLNSSQVIRVDSRTGMLTKYYVPNIQEKERTDLRGLAADADGNMWVVATEKGKLLKLDSRSGHFTEFSPPTEDAGPYSVDVDTKRNFIWFSEAYTDRIARFDPRTNTFVEFPHPSADSDVRRIEVDRSHPNRVWWAGNRSGKVGYIETLE